MRVGVVDLGTDLIRFDIYDVSKTGRARNLHRQKQKTRLGESVFSQGHLDAVSLNRLVEAIEDYQYEAYQFRVNHLVAYGTSALREAKNQRQILRLVEERTGIKVQIISGKQEAALTVSGILAKEKLSTGEFGLINIGDARTEITGCLGTTILLSSSLPLGVLRLRHLFTPGAPPQDTKTLSKKLEGALAPTATRFQKHSLSHCIGSSGTIKTLARILRRCCGERQIRIDSLVRLRKELRKMTPRELTKVPGLPERRASLIVPGAVLLETCMKACGVDTVLPSKFALRESLLEDVIAQIGHA